MTKNLSADVRKQQIFEAAMAVCSAQGYHATRMQDIAAAAGVSKGSLYYYFHTKQELFVELLEEFLSAERGRLKKKLATGMPARQTLQEAFYEGFKQADEMPGLMRGMIDFYVLAVREAEFRERFDGYYAEWVSLCADVIRRGIANGEFSPDLDPDSTGWSLVTALDGVMLTHIMLNHQKRVVESATLCLRILLDGIKAKEPRS